MESVPILFQAFAEEVLVGLVEVGATLGLLLLLLSLYGTLIVPATTAMGASLLSPLLALLGRPGQLLLAWLAPAVFWLPCGFLASKIAHALVLRIRHHIRRSYLYHADQVFDHEVAPPAPTPARRRVAGATGREDEEESVDPLPFVPDVLPEATAARGPSTAAPRHRRSGIQAEPTVVVARTPDFASIAGAVVSRTYSMTFDHPVHEVIHTHFNLLEPPLPDPRFPEIVGLDHPHTSQDGAGNTLRTRIIHVTLKGLPYLVRRAIGAEETMLFREESLEGHGAKWLRIVTQNTSLTNYGVGEEKIHFAPDPSDPEHKTRMDWTMQGVGHNFLGRQFAARLEGDTPSAFARATYERLVKRAAELFPRSVGR